MKSKKLPALQFYPGDWKKDPGIQALTMEERGIWLELLFLMHESHERGFLTVAGKPLSHERLAIALGIDNQKITTTINTLLDFGVASVRESDGAIYNRRMVKDEEERQQKTESGKLGGNPLFSKGSKNPYYNQKDNQEDKQKDKHPDKQKITPSYSTSTSTSNIGSKDPLTGFVFPDNFNSQKIRESLDAWLLHKKSRKESYKNQESIRRLLSHWAKFTEADFASAVDRSIRSNYAGLIDPTQDHRPRAQNRAASILADSGRSLAFEQNLDLIRKTEEEEKLQ